MISLVPTSPAKKVITGFRCACRSTEFERLVLLKRLYKSATLKEVADDLGKSEGIATNWVNRWIEGGLNKFTPNFGGGQPPKLKEDQQSKLINRLREGQTWETRGFRILSTTSSIQISSTLLPGVSRQSRPSYAISRTKRPD